nr:hypothetical protein [Tanacetum cinerariifolium]
MMDLVPTTTSELLSTLLHQLGHLGPTIVAGPPAGLISQAGSAQFTQRPRVMGPTQVSGQANTLSHAFTTETLRDFSNVSIRGTNVLAIRGREVLRHLVHDNFISCIKEKPLVLCHACQLGKHTPIDIESKLRVDGDPVSDMTLYRSLVGSLQNLTFTRPDLVAYSNVDWAGCPTTRRSNSGYCVLLGNNLLSWSSKRQPMLSRSSAEAEYRGVANAVAETCWLCNLLHKFHTHLSSTKLIYYDNVSAVYFSCNPVQHQGTKHIEIDIHFVCDLVVAGQVRILHVPSRYQFADIFTKGLSSALFEEFHSSLSVRCPPAPTARESLRINFFRGNVRGDRKLAWVSWDKVLENKEVGRLGVNSFYAMNRALLFKWVWRFKTQHDTLWVRVEAIHGLHESVDHIPPYSKSSTWIECVKGMIQLNKNGVDHESMRCPVGQNLANGLFSGFQSDPGGGRKGVKSSQLEDLHHITHLMELTTKLHCWVRSSSGLFLVASARKFIEEQLSICSGTPTAWRTRVKEKNKDVAIKDGVSPSMTDETVVKDLTSEMDKLRSLDDTTVLGSFPPLSTPVTTTAGNAPGKSSYANVTGKPSGKKVNVHTLFTPGGNGIDVVVSVDSIRAISERFANTAYGFFLGKKGRSSYARVIIELRADVELKDNIVVAMPKITREGHYTCNVHVEHEWKPPSYSSCKVFRHIHEECPKNTGAAEKKTVKMPSQTSRGIPVGPKMGFKPHKEYRPVFKKSTASSGGNKNKGAEPTIEKIEKFEDLLTSGQAILVDKARNPLKKVGFGTQSLLEQWRDSYSNGDYDDDPYDDDIQPPKRKSTDVGWEFGYLADPKHIDKVKCNICGKIVSKGVHRLKLHVTGISRDVTACEKSTTEQKLKCRNALNEVKLKKKSKQAVDDALRSEVNIGNNEMVDLDEMKYSFRDLKSPTRFGPLDRFATFKDCSDMGKKKQSNLSNLILKEKMIKVKEHICRWAYKCGASFHAFERDSFKTLLEVVGQFEPRALPHNRYEMGDTYLKKEVDRTKSLLKRYREEWELTGCSIMTYAWSNRKRRSIMNFCIESVGSEKVVRVVTNKAANNMGAANLLKEKRLTIFWTSCATHTINLMLEAKRLTIFIYAHHKTLALMTHFKKKRDIVRPGVTRFASAFLTLQSLAKKKAQLRQMFTSDEWENNKRRKARDHEVLLAQEEGEAQEWIVEGEMCEDRVEAGLPRETVSDDMGTRTSSRLRELYEEEFESEGEVEVDEEIEYESDGV